MFSKLLSLFRHPFSSLYIAYPDEALHLAASILKLIIDDHLTTILHLCQGSNVSNSAKGGWEKTIYALLSGILVRCLEHVDALLTTEKIRTILRTLIQVVFLSFK